MRLIWCMVASVLLLLSANMGSAQFLPRTLPGGTELVPEVWQDVETVVTGAWTARVSQAITEPGPGLYTYWYRIEHVQGHGLRSATLNISLDAVEQVVVHNDWTGDYWVLNFGETDSNVGQIWGPEPVLPGFPALRYSTQGGIFAGLLPGDTAYLWVRSTAGPGNTQLTLQNGMVATVEVLGPVVPEPGILPTAFAAAVLPLASHFRRVGGLRVRLKRR